MKEIFLFELKYRLRRPVTYIYMALMFIIPILIAVFEQSGTAQFTNSPNAIVGVLGPVSVLGIFFYAAIMGVPVFRDAEHHTAQTYFTFPVSEKNYILGRFFGSFTIVTVMNLAAMVGAMLGFGIGALLDRPDYGTYTGFEFASYFNPFLYLLTFNAFFIGSLFFMLMSFFKRMPILYLGGILLLILNTITNQLLSGLDTEWLSIYVDPFGGSAYSYITKYWSIAELNTTQMTLTGKFMLNRLLWLGLGIFIFLFVVFRFSFKGFLASSKKKKVKGDNEVFAAQEHLTIQQIFSKKTERTKLFSLSKIEFLSIIKEPVFLVLIALGVMIAGLIAYQSNQLYGTPSLPLTRYMVTQISAGIELFSIIILIIYAGEAVHRTRKNKTFEFYDALPVSDGTLYLSKIISLVGTAVILTILGIVVGILYQTINGYFAYELDVYLVYAFTTVLPKYIMVLLLAFFIHVVFNNKFLGHFIVILVYIGLPILVSLAFKSSNPLLTFGETTGGFISDLNGFGHYLTGKLWLNGYWILFTCILAVIGKIFWNRGFVSNFKDRFRLAKGRFNGKTLGYTLLFLLAFVSVAGYSYYNIKVLNKLEDSDYYDQQNADAEKAYEKFADRPHLKAIALKAAIDIYPEERRAEAIGDFTVVNKFNEPIDTLLLEVKFPISTTTIEKVVYNNIELQPFLKDSSYRLFVYKLPKALQPKDTASLQIQTKVFTKGFTTARQTAILHNGTFFRNDIFPSFHYERALQDNGLRKKYGLEELDYLFPPRTDSVGLRTNLFNSDSDYMTFEATVSTTPDQIAIAPGVLTKEWEENGRKYYHYNLSEKTDYFFNFVSADYNVLKRFLGFTKW